MFFIVMQHYSVHGNFDLKSYFSFNVYFVQCLGMFGKLGVNLFVLISGYFLCTSKFNYKRLLKLELQVLFYSVIISALFYIFLPQKIDLISFIKSFFPFFTSQYWFYTTYFILVLISPFLNVYIYSATKENIQKLILILFILWVFLPFIPKVPLLECSDLSWFIFLYIIASYIRKYGEDIKIKNSQVFLFSILSYVLILLSVLFFDLLGLWKNIFQTKFDYFIHQHSILIFLCSIFTFLFFQRLNIKHNKIINIISSLTFGVYLIHDNNFVRSFLWQDLFKNAEYIKSSFIFIHAFIAIIGVYIGCSIIEFFRQLIFKIFIRKSV